MDRDKAYLRTMPVSKDVIPKTTGTVNNAGISRSMIAAQELKGLNVKSALPTLAQSWSNHVRVPLPVLHTSMSVLYTPPHAGPLAFRGLRPTLPIPCDLALQTFLQSRLYVEIIHLVKPMRIVNVLRQPFLKGLMEIDESIIR